MGVKYIRRAALCHNKGQGRSESESVCNKTAARSPPHQVDLLSIPPCARRVAGQASPGAAHPTEHFGQRFVSSAVGLGPPRRLP